jgi:hypothetical protein
MSANQILHVRSKADMIGPESCESHGFIPIKQPPDSLIPVTRWGTGDFVCPTSRSEAVVVVTCERSGRQGNRIGYTLNTCLGKESRPEVSLESHIKELRQFIKSNIRLVSIATTHSARRYDQRWSRSNTPEEPGNTCAQEIAALLEDLWVKSGNLAAKCSFRSTDAGVLREDKVALELSQADRTQQEPILHLNNLTTKRWEPYLSQVTSPGFQPKPLVFSVGFNDSITDTHVLVEGIPLTDEELEEAQQQMLHKALATSRKQKSRQGHQFDAQTGELPSLDGSRLTTGRITGLNTLAVPGSRSSKSRSRSPTTAGPNRTPQTNQPGPLSLGRYNQLRPLRQQDISNKQRGSPSHLRTSTADTTHTPLIEGRSAQVLLPHSTEPHKLSDAQVRALIKATDSEQPDTRRSTPTGSGFPSKVTNPRLSRSPAIDPRISERQHLYPHDQSTTRQSSLRIPQTSNVAGPEMAQFPSNYTPSVATTVHGAPTSGTQQALRRQYGSSQAAFSGNGFGPGQLITDHSAAWVHDSPDQSLRPSDTTYCQPTIPFTVVDTGNHDSHDFYAFDPNYPAGSEYNFDDTHRQPEGRRLRGQEERM